MNRPPTSPHQRLLVDLVIIAVWGIGMLNATVFRVFDPHAAPQVPAVTVIAVAAIVINHLRARDRSKQEKEE